MKKANGNPLNRVIILTDEQVKTLQPLFDYARKQALKGNKGIIFAQPYQYEFVGNIWYSEFRCAFVKKKYADKMIEISKKAKTLIPKPRERK